MEESSQNEKKRIIMMKYIYMMNCNGIGQNGRKV
jgi:hypothetical protein